MRLIILPFLLVLIYSCSKQKLNGEAEELRGTWYVSHISGEDYGTYSPISQHDENRFEIRFEKNGKVILYNGEGEILERGRIKYYSDQRMNDFPYTLFIDVEINSNQVAFSRLERINSLAIEGFYNDQVLRITDFTKSKGIDEFYFRK